MQTCSWMSQTRRKFSGKDVDPQPASKKYWQEGHSEVSLPLPYSLPGKQNWLCLLVKVMVTTSHDENSENGQQ